MIKLFHASLRVIVTTACAGLAFLLVDLGPRCGGAAALGQPALDPPEIRATSDVVPPALLRGPHDRQQDHGRSLTGISDRDVPIDRSAAVDRKVLGDCGRACSKLPKPQPARPIEIWMTGDAADHAREGLQQLGTTLVEHAGQQLPLLD